MRSLPSSLTRRQESPERIVPLRVITSFTPVTVGLLGIPRLGEFPDGIGWIDIAS
jgi:hypothetical protein